MIRWLRNRRRERVAALPFPREWSQYIERNVPYYRMLPPEMQERLRGTVQVLLAEKHFEGCGGFTITDEVRVTIAGHAACLLLGRDADYFPRLSTILVYPSMFYVPDDRPDVDGTMTEEEDEHAGQSWDLGVVVLAWDEVILSGDRAEDGYNVVLHEFAHQLDAAAAGTDGVPLLDDRAMRERWAEVMQRNYRRLERDVRRGRYTVLDPYGLEDPAEFFAVAAETFFEMPLELRDRHPELYTLLKDYFRQDPARLAGEESS